MQDNKTQKSYRAGFLGLIGQPNAGKSTLMNLLVDEKVSIVTSKPQTTRRRVIGLHNTSDGQIVFVDAPGVIKATSGLNNFLQKEAEDVIKSSDALLAILSIDEDKIESLEQILEMVKACKKPWLAVITKIDIAEKAHRIPILTELVRKNGGEYVLLSSKEINADTQKELLKKALALLPESAAPLYDTELYTTETVKALSEEIVREKCFEILKQEIPYQVAVQVRKFDEDAKPCPKIYMDIIVAKESQKPIIIGKGAANIKKIGELSRPEIQKVMGVDKVFLDLNVTVVENWFEKNKLMKELKYVIDSE